MFLLSKLKYLDLSHNMLSEIPEEITKLKFLTTFRIQNNQISKFSKVVSDYLGKLSNFKI